MNAPQDAAHQAEYAILSALMTWNGNLNVAAEVLSICPEEVFTGNARPIRGSIGSILGRGELPDTAGVIHEMKGAVTLALAGGAGVVSDIAMGFKDFILTEARLLECAHELADEHKRKEAVQSVAGILRVMQEGGADSAAIAERLRDIAGGLGGEYGVPGTSPFNVLSGSDLLALPRPMWRVKGLLPQCGTAVVHGPSGSGKTFTVLDLALATALEEEWFGWKTTHCDILYICLESVWGLQGRLKAWALDKQRGLPENVRFIIEPFDLGNKQHVKAISAIAPKGGVLIIDTLNRATPGMDENSSKDMSGIISAANEIQTAMQGLVLLVSHSGKDTSKGIRGHSSLFAALDANIEVSRNGDTRFLKVCKLKEGEDGAKKFFRLKPVVIGADEDGEDITSCVVEPMDEDATGKMEDKPLTRSLDYALESLVKALRHAGTSTVNIESWRKYFYEGHTADNDDAKRQAFLRARSGLVERQRVFVINDSYGVTDRYNNVTCNALSRTQDRDVFA